jgi:hypothetical protein
MYLPGHTLGECGLFFNIHQTHIAPFIHQPRLDLLTLFGLLDAVEPGNPHLQPILTMEGSEYEVPSPLIYPPVIHEHSCIITAAATPTTLHRTNKVQTRQILLSQMLQNRRFDPHLPWPCCPRIPSGQH